MTFERNAEEVEDFALKGDGRGPNGNRAGDSRIFAGEPNLQAQTLAVFQGKQVVHHLEARLLRVKVQGGDVGQETKF